MFNFAQSMEHSSDLALLQQIKANDHAAFDVLFDRYWEKLYKAALARLGDDVIAQDIVQEIFIKVWQRREKLSINTSIENYLLGAVRFSVIGHFRSQQASDLRMRDALERINLLEDSIEAIADYIELEKTLEEAENSMPEMLKKVYKLRCDNLSIKAIAGELGLADQTVKNYIAEATRRLRVVIVEKYPEKHLSYLALLMALLHK
ncbi:RNA polymerase sigma factor [Mucilaginibacter aquaedulcis]|uniref:RNA polymerase sigma factor n=1 Tax=Mucilaginibacter aquaedulcis TaxID=1187081 RepID=UPI0025B5945E|nr:sigma-70 family RNA polymerase sigma factor [Mucilaginibacter aquaedulcis]MDN3546912.1 sigma-70 family RNA polymerase sigma factor [Mucilaginibacter aquaedulcis]